MITLYLAIILILVIFIVALLIKFKVKWLQKKSLCVICAAVFVTWATLFIAQWFIDWIDQRVIAILLGQSIVGGMYAFERRLIKIDQSGLWWKKLLFIILGTAITFLALEENWLGFVISLILLVAMVMFALLSSPKGRAATVVSNAQHKSLRDKLEHCCD